MSSTTFVDNQTVIYASWLNDVNAVAYNGTFIASIVTPSNLVCNGTVSGNGFNNLISNVLASPPAIGSVTPNSGAFSTLGLTNPLAANYGGTGLTSPGTSGNVLTSNGSAWISSSPSKLISTRYITTTGTYTATSGTNFVIVEVVGGGGGVTNSGGTSSFGSFCSATGGQGGNPGSGGLGSGGDLNAGGGSGGSSFGSSIGNGGTSAFGYGGGSVGYGAGGSNGYNGGGGGGGGGARKRINSGFSGTTVTIGAGGDNGTAGIVIVYEYA